MSTDAQSALTKNAEVLKQNATRVVSIEGHCDERGTAEHNLALGERRALAARTYLVSLGIAPDRLRTVSYGKEFPFDPAETRGPRTAARTSWSPPSSRRARRTQAMEKGPCVKQRRCHGGLGGGWEPQALVLIGGSSPLAAANREHAQMMADIRMLQEQNQQLRDSARFSMR